MPTKLVSGLQRLNRFNSGGSRAARHPACIRPRMSFRIVALVCAAAAILLPAPAAAQLRAVTYVTGLSSPVAFVQDPGNPTIQYVVQQGGRIRVVSNGVLQTTDFLNLSSSI